MVDGLPPLLEGPATASVGTMASAAWLTSPATSPGGAMLSSERCDLALRAALAERSGSAEAWTIVFFPASGRETESAEGAEPLSLPTTTPGSTTAAARADPTTRVIASTAKIRLTIVPPTTDSL